MRDGSAQPRPPARGDSGTLTTSNTLTLAAPTLAFDLSGSPGGANDRIVMQGGQLAMSGVQNYVFTLTDNALGAGTYSLIEGATDSTAWSGVTHNLPSGTRQSFNIYRAAAGSNPSYVRLSVTGNAASLVWSGTAGSAWDVSATTNWLNGDSASTFYHLDAVRFDDSTTNGSVTISGTVQPASVSVTNNTRAYTLGGGDLSGPCALVKSGSNYLTLTGANTYSGGTAIRGGTLYLANDTAIQSGLGSGPVTLQGGTLSMFSDVYSYNSAYWNLAVPDGSGGRLNTDARCYLRGSLTGGGTLDYYVTYVRTELDGDWSAFTGQINVLTDGDGGDFRINNSFGYGDAAIHFTAKAAAYHMSAGTVAVGALSGDAGAYLGSAQWVVGGRNTDATYNGSISGSTSLTKTGTGVWSLGGRCTHTGATVVDAGTLRLLASASVTNENTLTVLDGATLDLQGAALNLESINILAGGALTGGATVDGDWINAGTAAVTGRMNVLGNIENSGTLTVAGTLASSLPITLAAGTLRVAAGGAIEPSCSLELASGAVFDLDGTAQTVTGLSGSGLVTNGALTVTGTLAPGGPNMIGTVTLAASTVLSGTLLVDVAADGSGDLLRVQGALALTGSTLQLQDVSQLTAEKPYVIARCAPGGLSGVFTSTDLGSSRWGVCYDKAAGVVSLIRIGLVLTVR